MKEVIKELFPPDTPPILRWRLAVFAFCILVMFHIVWACGWLEPLGIEESKGGGLGFLTMARDEVHRFRNISALKRMGQRLFQ